MELPDIPALARGSAAARRKADAAAYPDCLAELDAPALRALGEEYLERTRIQRKTDRPFFIDKMPNNWAHVGLIHLILPNAKIIDARRHPLDCCFSNFKQHFARGQGFSYALDRHGPLLCRLCRADGAFRRGAAGPVHRVIHERLIDDPEARDPRAARLSRPALRAGLPALPRDRARRAHRQLRAGPPPDQPRRRRPVARLRALARSAKQALGPVLDDWPNAPA